MLQAQNDYFNIFDKCKIYLIEIFNKKFGKSGFKLKIFYALRVLSNENHFIKT